MGSAMWLAGVVVWTMIGDVASVDAVKAGADPTGQTLSTAALQRAIDEVASAGGEVRVPKGEYKVTALRLKSGVTLRLDAGAVLRPSRESADYGEEKLPTVGAEGATEHRGGRTRRDRRRGRLLLRRQRRGPESATAALRA